MNFDNKLIISPDTPAVGDKLKINYTGDLCSNSKDNIYLHVGYTNNSDKWIDIQNIQMYKNNDNIFEAVIPIKKKDKLNFAFYDDNGMWDNNNGSDYSIQIEKRPNW